MDGRLLDIIVCPVCRGDLSFLAGGQPEQNDLSCAGCGVRYSLVDGVADLVPPGTDRDGAFSDEWAQSLREWIEQHFQRWRSRTLGTAERDIVGILRSIGGAVLDVASGPGGSLCVPLMMDGRTDRLRIMSDLGPPVMPAWRRVLEDAGWGDRCATITCDARSLPFRDSSMDAISSVIGLDNVSQNRLAYSEAARVLGPGGRLLDIARFYEDGGLTHRRLSDTAEAAASWPDYGRLLAELGFRVDRREIVSAGRGKSDPRDGLPIGDESWENVAVFATRLST